MILVVIRLRVMASKIQHLSVMTEHRLRNWMPVLFLADVAFMFSAIFFLNATAWWVWLPFQLLACLCTAFVLYLAYRAKPFVPTSIPIQRQIGVFLYLSCHGIQFFTPGQIPIGLVGYLLLAAPLSIVFLFDQLNTE